MAKIKVIPDDRIEALLPQKTSTRVVGTTLDGRQDIIEISNPLGHPENPMQDCHIEEKLVSLVEPALGKARCVAALDTWWRLEEASGVSAAMQLLDINRQRRIGRCGLE
jgi:2-methylcitrate dehydratase PrpD